MTSTDTLNSSPMDTHDNDEDEVPECAICLNPCLQPVQLPCGHIFCFLCAKGIALQSKKCALCRATIPQSFLFKPNMYAKKLDVDESGDDAEDPVTDSYAWFYQGKQGWWKYDERTSEEIETAYVEKLDSLDVLIAGAVYIIDLKNKIQYQKNRNWRRREIKRDVVTASRKGVAGMHDAGKGDDVTGTTNTDGGAGTSSAPQTPGSQTAVQMALGHLSSQTPSNVPSTSASSIVSNVAPPPAVRNRPLGGSNNAPASSLPLGQHHSYNTRSSS